MIALIRSVWYTKRWNQLIQRSIYWKSKRINGNFWPIHSPNICECASHIWVYRIGNYALRTHAIYHHGQNNYSYYSHRIYLSTTIAIHPNRIVYRLDHGSQLFTTNWMFQFFDQNQNAPNKRISSVNKLLSYISNLVDSRQRLRLV